MNHFRLISHLDTFAVVAQLFRLKPDSWKGVPERGEVNKPEIGLGASLLLRGHDNVTHKNWLEDLPVRDQKALTDWPSMQRLLKKAHRAIMAEPLGKTYLSGTMARAMVSRLDPGSTIFWHVDDGPYHSRTYRFHLPLVTNPGCLMYSSNECIHMPVGSLWFFDNHVRHCAANWGTLPRLHLIFEMYKADARDNDEA